MEDIQEQMEQLTLVVETSQKQSSETVESRDISEAALAANWIRIFNYYNPGKEYVLDQYRESHLRIISFIRAWFAISEQNDFLRLDTLARDPSFNSLSNALGNDDTSSETKKFQDYPGKTYSSFEQWFYDTEKPEGWIYDEETQCLVQFSHWLASKDLDNQTTDWNEEQETISSESGNFGSESTELAAHFEQTQIDDAMND